MLRHFCCWIMDVSCIGLWFSHKAHNARRHRHTDRWAEGQKVLSSTTPCCRYILQGWKNLVCRYHAHFAAIAPIFVVYHSHFVNAANPRPSWSPPSAPLTVPHDYPNPIQHHNIAAISLASALPALKRLIGSFCDKICLSLLQNQCRSYTWAGRAATHHARHRGMDEEAHVNERGWGTGKEGGRRAE